MSATLIIGLISAGLMVAVGVIAYRAGSSKVKLDTSEQTNRERERDAEIASRPYSDRPFDGLRPKD